MSNRRNHAIAAIGVCALAAAALLVAQAVRGVQSHAAEGTHDHSGTTQTTAMALHKDASTTPCTDDHAHSESETTASAAHSADCGHDHSAEARPSPTPDPHAGHDHSSEAKPKAGENSHEGHSNSETEAKVPAGHSADDGHDHSAKAKPSPTPDPHAGHDHATEEKAESAPDSHAGHDHAAEAKTGAAEDPHAGHNHAAEGHTDEVKLSPDAVRDSGIKVEEARNRELSDELTVPGRVSFNLDRMAHIGTNVQGRVAELHAKLGDRFSKGDPLLVIDSPALGETQSECLQKRTQVEVAESEVEIARTAFERAKLLTDSKAMAVSELQKREGEFKVAQGALQTARASLTSSENNLRLLGMDQAALEHLARTRQINPRYTVRAPIDGIVVEREVTLGEVVGPDRDALMVLADMATLWVLADVPESRIHEIETGTTATVTVRASQELVLPGRLTFVAPSMQKSTRTVQARVEVEDGHIALKPGMFAEVRLKCRPDAVSSGTAMLAVPESAILTVEGKPSVFAEVTGEPCTYIRKPVEPGPTIGGMVRIVSGLEEGSRIVTGGTFILKAELAKGEMEGHTCSGH